MQLTGIHAIVLDIEGTVGPISFVREVLFPYARARFADWCRELPAADRRQLIASLRAELAEPCLDTAGAVRVLTDWTDRDVKAPILKAAQARIWHTGFRDGELRSTAYPDVAPALRRWHDEGMRLYIYSSGAEQAQRDWFGHTADGDLTPLLSGYFDLHSAGSKTDPASYVAIARAIGLAPDAIAFLTDAAGEVTAARRAGLHAVLVARDGVGDDAAGIDSFDRITMK